MIFIAGGTGLLGTQVVGLLTACGRQVRVLTRDPARAQHLVGERVGVFQGDVRNHSMLDQAVKGSRIVISAIQGFSGSGSVNPQTVDLQGNSALIEAARKSGVEHFILVSVHGAAPNHPIELFRMKYRAEQELKASGLPWTIIRPTAYMETWTGLVAGPLLTSRRTRIFGRGVNPINFVSAHDVAQFVAWATQATNMQGEYVAVGGPENLSMRQVVQTFMDVTQVTGTAMTVPVPMMRVMAVLLRPVNSTLARQIQAGIVMDTVDMTFDPADMRRQYPTMSYTTLADMIRRDYGRSQ